MLFRNFFVFLLFLFDEAFLIIVIIPHIFLHLFNFSCFILLGVIILMKAKEHCALEITKRKHLVRLKPSALKNHIFLYNQNKEQAVLQKLKSFLLLCSVPLSLTSWHPSC